MESIRRCTVRVWSLLCSAKLGLALIALLAVASAYGLLTGPWPGALPQGLLTALQVGLALNLSCCLSRQLRAATRSLSSHPSTEGRQPFAPRYGLSRSFHSLAEVDDFLTICSRRIGLRLQPPRPIRGEDLWLVHDNPLGFFGLPLLHLGLLLILIGLTLQPWLGSTRYFETTEGALLPLEEAYGYPFSLLVTNLDVLDRGNAAPEYLTHAVILEHQRPVGQADIRVNHPLQRDGVKVYQATAMFEKKLTGLLVKEEPTLPLVYAGFIVTGVGLALHYTVQPRRAWVAVNPSPDGYRLHLSLDFASPTPPKDGTVS